MTGATETPTTAGQPATGLNAFQPRLTHVAYHVADIDRALGFYVGVLGFKEQMRFPLGDNLFEAVLGFPDGKGAGLLLMWSTARSAPYQLGDGYSRLVINVSDVDAVVAYLERHDTPIVAQPRQAGAFRYALVKDPDGYVIEILQLKRT
jgi:lactoylglutathione lyase